VTLLSVSIQSVVLEYLRFAYEALDMVPASVDHNPRNGQLTHIRMNLDNDSEGDLEAQGYHFEAS
jgi:hypothetical protein